MTGQFIIQPKKIIIGADNVGEIIDTAYGHHRNRRKRFDKIFFSEKKPSKTELLSLERHFQILEKYEENSCLVIQDNSISSLLRGLQILGIKVERLDEQQKIIQKIEKKTWGREFLQNEKFNKLPELTQAIFGLKHRLAQQNKASADRINRLYKQFLLAHLGREQETKNLTSRFKSYKRLLNSPVPSSSKEKSWTIWNGSSDPLKRLGQS